MNCSRKCWKRTFPGMVNSKFYLRQALKIGLHLVWSDIVSLYNEWLEVRDDGLFKSEMDKLMKIQTNLPAPIQCIQPRYTFSFAHTEPTQTVTQAEYLAGSKYMSTHAIEEKPMRDDMFAVRTTASTINISPAASASVTQKTDLQNQREYLQERLSDVKSSFRYGVIHSKMRDAFAIGIDNQPKTAKELIDGITSGKFTLDAKKMEVQNVAISTGEVYDRDENMYVYPNDPLYAMNWGGLPPDLVGYTNAKIAFEADIKAAADIIMIGEPTAALSAIQALEAWGPPAAAAN